MFLQAHAWDIECPAPAKNVGRFPSTYGNDRSDALIR